MNRRSGRNAPEALWKDWSCWIGIVEAAAHGRMSRLHTDPSQYEALHQRLLNASRELAQSGDEEQRSFFGVMEATIRPWLSLRVLEQADREILGHLLERCRRIERVLAGRGAVAWRTAATILLFITASTVSFALLWVAFRHWSSLVFAIKGEARVLWSSVERLSHVEQLFAVGLFVVVLSIYNVSRAARS
jgi:hypothetical protein